MIRNLLPPSAGHPRLLVLGAGLYQLAGIRAALARGCEVVTVDNVPSNPGHQLASASFNVSTVDIDGVIALARTLHVSGVATFASDVATETVARCAVELGLSGADPEAVRMLSNKGAFRRLQTSAGLPHPTFEVVRTGDLLPSMGEGVGGVAVKPTDSSGSRGVSIVLSPVDDVMHRALDEARGASRSGEVIVEAFLPGTEVGGDAFIVDGSVALCQVTQKHVRGVVVTGHSLPPIVAPEITAEIARQLQAACRLAGYRTGPINFDVMLDDGGVVIIEMSPRTGGNGIPEVIERSYGVSPLAASIDFALGRIPNLEQGVEEVRPSGSLVLGSPVGGEVRSIATPHEVKRKVPGVYAIDVLASIGDSVATFHSGSASFGYALFDVDQSYSHMVDQIEAALGLEVA